MGTLRRTCRLLQRRGPLPKLLWADLLLLLTLCDPIWHVIFRSSEVITTNCYTPLFHHKALYISDLACAAMAEDASDAALSRSLTLTRKLTYVHVDAVL